MRVRAGVPNALPVSDSTTATAGGNTQTSPRLTRTSHKLKRACLCLPFVSRGSSSSSTSTSLQTQRTTFAMNPIASSSTAPPRGTSSSSDPASVTIKTRILIISDTHGVRPTETAPPEPETLSSPCTLYGHTSSRSPFHLPLPAADVVIHCGDLTKRSSVEEYRSTISVLRQIQAPVKIAIAGNHDLSLHQQFIKENIDDVNKSQPSLVWLARQVAMHAEARNVLTENKDITYLEEGTQEIVLLNGAKLRLYTSPWTPSYGGWAFQYEGSHNFSIPQGIDVAVTHGPPLGMQDYAASGDYAGCPMLFNSIQKARPRIHCFGHIHEAWGGYYGHWAFPEGTSWQQAVGTGDPGASAAPDTSSYYGNNSDSDASMTPPPPQTLDALDPERSYVIENVNSIRLSRGDSEEEASRKREKYARYSSQGCCHVDVSPEGQIPVERGKQTLFLNAAILDRRYKIAHFPWLVEIDLPRA
ncbi:hypothetical protein jhhlp_001381 [Lomentospora prolificans]|uniref:Calcineurin-like phosphoesterase domain-containing protein n=1 Tax=Lomentospora prolificans TaxID=41688 RepID=A0A2N3NI20_9PEZI|nr:hypothetical protein jhhlp_001381 [Lomentospora prolificans]